jgi:hypothetical protein
MTTPQDIPNAAQKPQAQPETPEAQPENPQAQADRLIKAMVAQSTATPEFKVAVANAVKEALEGMNLGTVIARSVNAAIDQRVAGAQAAQKTDAAPGDAPPPQQGGLGELMALARMMGLGPGGSPGGDLGQMEAMGKMMGSFFGNVLGPVQGLYDAGRRDFASQLTLMARANIPITLEGLDAVSAPTAAPSTVVAHQQQAPDIGSVISAVARGIKLSP